MSKKHSRIGASSAERWFECAGSVRMSEGMPNIASEYAKEGTAAHELGEKCLINKKAAVDYLDTEITVDGSTFIVNEEMVHSVQMYVDFCNSLKTPGVICGIENKFSLVSIDPDLFGTTDFYAYDKKTKTLSVVDFKYGKGHAVEVKENKQLMYYARGAMEKHPDAEHIKITVVQPRCPHKDGPIRTWETSGAKLITWASTHLAYAVEETKKEDASLSAGDHCRFCPAQGVCPELKNKAYKSMLADFENLPTPSGQVKKIAVLPQVEVLSDAQISEVMQSASMIDSWLRQVEAHAQRRLESGGKIEGFKLVRRTKHRVYTNAEMLQEMLFDKYGDKIYQDRKLLTPAQLEKILKPEDKSLFESMVDKPIGDLTIAANTDRRAEVIVDPKAVIASDFDVLDN